MSTPASAGSQPGRERDRDEEGRARNARPRDGLGRPLPHGAAGVERQPEGVDRTPEQAVSEAQRLLDDGMPFHAHEVFEDAWKSELEPDPLLWKGLAQLAVGLTHAARGNAVGGARLLRRGREHIQPHAEGTPHGMDISGLLAWAGQLAGELDAGHTVSSAAERAPRLRGRQQAR
ncbi:DUF309 domain-containing protein [Haloechinothrix sp. LS1_15]|uniref:DUF309 domain-containing protein n=1 Tax=Haloechinothrix sp. LS1_15 TaxID=2652248 RepID=UPI002945F853|nr:DUF309 domain-containing protein [Haloechinothrix sp. LS1_15]MDV6013307.1 DUF309 domain-containing protein [Haloechinothrix sp. LS1_15]